MKYCERIYSESEIKLIKEIFDLYIKQIYDDDLEKIINDCKEIFLENQKVLKEIERLNKRWNELKTYINDMWLDDKGSVRRLQEFVKLLESGSDE